MKKVFIACLTALMLLAGCQQTPFEPAVSKAVDYLELNAAYDPLTLIKDDDNAGLVFEVKENTIDTATPGDYTITYKISSSDNRKSTEMTFDFAVADQDAPTLVCPQAITHKLGTAFLISDYATASDQREGDLTSVITYSGQVNGYVAGTYNIVVSVADAYANTATLDVKVTVSGDAISLAGTYNDSSYTAGAAPSLTLNDDGSFYMSLNTCSSLSAADGFWVQAGTKLYLTSETFSFSQTPEKNIIVLLINNDGTLSFDSELDYCAPSRGDIFTR